MLSSMVKTEDAKLHKSLDEALVLQFLTKLVMDLAVMTLALAKTKVFWSIILLVQIDVVNPLALVQATPKSSLHNEPMFRNPMT